MSLDANLIDLDDRVIYDISGGRHLWWMLPRVKGHRLIITHDDNAGMGAEEERKFISLGYKEVDCDLLSEELSIDFSILPECSYSISTNLVDLAYGIYFNAQHLNWIPEDFKLQHGVDEESGLFWFKVPSITKLLNCTDNLFSLSFSNCMHSCYGDNLMDKAFIENLKEFGNLVNRNLEVK